VTNEKRNLSGDVGISGQDLRRSRFSVDAIQFQELDWWRLLDLDAEVAGDLAQGVIEVRKVIDGHVANEGATNFVVARASVQPAQKEEQLQA
jgi:hypothetical protein